MPGRLRLVEGRIERLGVDGLKTIASTSSAIRVRMSASWPCGIGVPVDHVPDSTCPEASACGLGGAELLLAEAVADAAAGSRTRSCTSRRRRGRLAGRGGSDAAGADAAGSDAAGGRGRRGGTTATEQAAATPRLPRCRRAVETWIIPVRSSSCARRTFSSRRPMGAPHRGPIRCRLFRAPPARVVRGHQACPTDGAGYSLRMLTIGVLEQRPASVRRLRPTLG